MTAKRFCLLLLFSWSLIGMAQQRTVAGTVKNVKGEPLAGATIKEKDQNENSVQSDDAGLFRIVLKGTTNSIIITSVGYAPLTVDVKGKTSVSVSMQEDLKGMEDVVVVGYGRQKKISVVGAVQTIKPSELRVPTSNLRRAGC